MVERAKTGIPGLDEILNGGIPKRNVVLLSGGPGTGKSIFSYQYLWSGLQMGEPGIFVALEEHPVQVRINMSQFGWDVRKYEKDGLFAIVDAFTGGIGEAAKREKYVVSDVDNIDEFLDVLSEFLDVLRNAIKETNAQRIAVDSVSTLYLAKPAMARKIVMSLKRVLAGLGLTGILVSQVSVTEKGFGGPGVEHAADGIIRLDLDEVDGQLIRSLIVWKMRGTSHSLKRHRFDITDKGIVVYPDKIVKLGRMVRVEERVEG